ncbi:MAG: hypothetical protein ACREDT_13880 [Methylocella sp.]
MIASHQAPVTVVADAAKTPGVGPPGFDLDRRQLLPKLHDR